MEKLDIFDILVDIHAWYNPCLTETPKRIFPPILMLKNELCELTEIDTDTRTGPNRIFSAWCVRVCE